MQPLTASYTNPDCPARLGHLVNTLTGETYLAGCKKWTCFACGPRRLRRFMRRVREGGDYRYMVTLTLDGDASDVRAAGSRLAIGWRALYLHLRKRAELRHFAWVRERGARSGRLHLHAVVNCKRFDYRRARDVIARSGLGPVCDFQRLRSSRGGARYVSKYLAKDLSKHPFPPHFRRAQTSVREHREKQPGWIFERAIRPARVNPWKELRPFELRPTQDELNPEPRQLSLALTKKEKLSRSGVLITRCHESMTGIAHMGAARAGP